MPQSVTAAIDVLHLHVLHQQRPTRQSAEKINHFLHCQAIFILIKYFVDGIFSRAEMLGLCFRASRRHSYWCEHKQYVFWVWRFLNLARSVVFRRGNEKRVRLMLALSSSFSTVQFDLRWANETELNCENRYCSPRCGLISFDFMPDYWSISQINACKSSKMLTNDLNPLRLQHESFFPYKRIKFSASITFNWNIFIARRLSWLLRDERKHCEAWSFEAICRFDRIRFSFRFEWSLLLSSLRVM